MLNIKEIALKVADSLRNKVDGISHMQSNQGLVRFSEALVERLLAENERLKAELAKYRDAPVVAWCHYDYAEKTADYLQHFKDTYASIPLIVKPGE
jgi:hypothetical protein